MSKKDDQTVTQPDALIVTARVVTSDELALIKTTVAVGATDAELKLFLFDCKRQGVHPLDRLLHFTKRGGKYTPVTSIDFMRIRAADSGEMAGSDDPVFDDDIDHESLRPLTEKPPRSATVTVYRLTQGQRFAYTATARWSEYKPDQDFMWRKMPRTMLGKCAEALALRKGFPRQLAGLYAKEEMDQAGPSTTGPTEIPQAEPASPTTDSGRREGGVAPGVDAPGTVGLPAQSETHAERIARIKREHNITPAPPAAGIPSGMLTADEVF